MKRQDILKLPHVYLNGFTLILQLFLCWNWKGKVKTNIWKSLNNFVTIVHRSSNSKSNFALPAASYLPRSLPLAKPNIIKKAPKPGCVDRNNGLLTFSYIDLFRPYWFISGRLAFGNGWAVFRAISKFCGPNEVSKSIARILLPREDFVGDKSKGCELPGSHGQVGNLIFIADHYNRHKSSFSCNFHFPFISAISEYPW